MIISQDDQIGVPIDFFEVSIRAERALKNHGIKTIEQALMLDEDEILSWRNVGVKTALEILDEQESLSGLAWHTEIKRIFITRLEEKLEKKNTEMKKIADEIEMVKKEVNNFETLLRSKGRTG